MREAPGFIPGAFLLQQGYAGEIGTLSGFAMSPF
jgi:hypothetical protein